jgi:hypothetical protein
MQNSAHFGPNQTPNCTLSIYEVLMKSYDYKFGLNSSIAALTFSIAALTFSIAV